MSVSDTGNINLSECDDANIPVNCFLLEPKDNDDYPGKWGWFASNFMPRKSCIVEHSYELVADTKEEILELVSKHVTPLYQIALDNIKSGELYYWSKS